MKMRNFITCFFTIIVMFIFLQHHLVASLSSNMQKTALFQFKQSLSITTPTDCVYYTYDYTPYYEIPSHPKTMNWSMSTDYCTWEGVSCDHKTGDVIGLDLSCSQLEGAILPNNTLFQLSHLRFLNLSWNNFSLSDEFPQEFGFFAKGLTHLNLSNTGFSGRVPSGISRLYKLVSLDLTDYFHGGGTQLEEEVFKSLLQNLTQLRVLNLAFVNISSVFPVNFSTSLTVLDLRRTGLHGVVPQEVFHLPNLEVLDLSTFPTWRSSDLSSGDLTATLPKVKWGSSATLQLLHLGWVNLNGGIPDSIGFLESLVRLVLYGCNLSGPIPRSIGHLGHLSVLRVVNVRFTGLHGVVPQEVFHLPNLELLDLSSYGYNLTVTLPKVKWRSSASLQGLYLSGINIYGGIPDSIGFLQSLGTLNLGDCNLYGPIPSSIGHLGQLTYLGLSRNNLNGPIPTDLTNLTNLRDLSLSNNNFTGPFPSVPHLRELNSLDVSNNSLTGPIPPSFFDLPSLETLNLSHNGFTGQLYEFDSSESQLQSFSCRNNLLNGPIPQSISRLVNLTLLEFSSNNFNGPIPQSFSRLLNLTYLYFSSNNFSGVLDLEMFSRLEYLRILDLSHNSLSVRSASMATLPPKLKYLGLSSCNMKEFPHFSRDAEISLNRVDLSNNQIEGEIPHWIGLMVQYNSDSYLNLSDNRLTGGLEKLPWNNIRYLDLHSNMLNGSLPTLFCNSSSLEILNLSNNSLSGVLPDCSLNLTYLSVFDLQMNNLQGNIPATLSNFRYLKTLNLHGNKLEGRIPSSFAELNNLETLDLGSNQINDTFPQCLEALPNLQVLVLKSNKFHGIINKSSKIEHPFPSLRIIDLSDNELSGPLPAMYFKNFKAMMNGDMNETKPRYMGNNYYSDSTSLVIKGVEIQLFRILTVFTTIDVSSNKFEGQIVDYIENLVSLRLLNFSHNHLTGYIPSSIGKLPMLESLDLSSNQLEGEIPPQLTSIYTLARLNLSSNQLRGHIPEGSQFNTFENDSYVGNLGLCGHPLSKKCENHIGTQEDEDDEDDDYFFNGFTWEAVVIGYGCGVVPAFIIGYLMLLARKPKWFVGIIARELGLKIRRMEIKWR